MLLVKGVAYRPPIRLRRQNNLKLYKVKDAEKVRKNQEEDQRLKEQEELDLAIALSLDEAEQAKRAKEATHAPTPAEPQQPAEPPGEQLPQLASDNGKPN